MNEFLVAWPPERVAPGGQYLHGVIDCLYQDESGNWHLLDYKTNQGSAAKALGCWAGSPVELVIY